MSRRLPTDGTFITDGGMETTLIFKQGMDLPSFASFVLLDDERGIEELRSYFEPYVEVARRHGVGLILDTPTWRANPDWGAQLGYSAEELADVNRRGVALVEQIRAENEDLEILISGSVGPRGDGYAVKDVMTPAEAQEYHSPQVAAFGDTGADLVTALTMTYGQEAVGIVRAAQAAEMPVVVSFTVETDGRLPSGEPLEEAIDHVDSETGGAPAYFMINCAHPTHFAHLFEGTAAPWVSRLGGLRANASSKSHAELDEAEELDEGDPEELGAQYGELRSRLPEGRVVGGCCGTDARHVEQMCKAWVAAA
jgi:S-methylmethionine-dependent homocysteine/selenocysteine methylase